MAKMPRRRSLGGGAEGVDGAQREGGVQARSRRGGLVECAPVACVASGKLGEGVRGGVDVEQRPDHDDGAGRRGVGGNVCGKKAVRLGAQR
jgi:hypothetical protein